MSIHAKAITPTSSLKVRLTSVSNNNNAESVKKVRVGIQDKEIAFANRGERSRKELQTVNLRAFKRQLRDCNKKEGLGNQIKQNKNQRRYLNSQIANAKQYLQD